MNRTIEIKHIEPRTQVRQLLEELCDRLEEKLQHFRQESVSIHIQFEENGRRTLSHIKLSCHLPGHLVAAHEEGREPGAIIRKAFAEIERQIEKQKAHVRGDYQRRKQRRLKRTVAPSAGSAPEAE